MTDAHHRTEDDAIPEGSPRGTGAPWDEWTWSSPEDERTAATTSAATRPIPAVTAGPPPAEEPWRPPLGAQPPAQQVARAPEEHTAGGPPAYAASPQPWPPYAAQPPPPQPPRRRGPGWFGVTVIALCAALVAGLLGGVLGAAFGDRASEIVTGGGDRVAAPTPGEGATERPEGSIANIAATALPSVVTIEVSTGGGAGATGSGFVFDDQGHIITNNHVVAAGGDDGRIIVQLSNGQQLEASLVGADAAYDLAVLKVDGANLTPLPMGSSSDVVVGDRVIAVGAPLGLNSTVTSGIVSALDRPVSAGDGNQRSYINAIQTDAAINPGNSGGPLLDMEGRVIGVNSAIAQPPGSGFGDAVGSIGLGFAIPSDQVVKTVEQLIETGEAKHPIIGVLLDLRYEGEGVRILGEDESERPSVVADGPADRAGLKPGDVIIAFEGEPMIDPDALVVAIRARDVGETVSLTVRRGSEEIRVRMTLQASAE